MLYLQNNVVYSFSLSGLLFAQRILKFYEKAEVTLLHKDYTNQQYFTSENKRTVLTLWYYPDYVNLPERTQATIYSLENQKHWPFINNAYEHIYNKYRIEYKGKAKIIEQEWKPGKDLT